MRPRRAATLLAVVAATVAPGCGRHEGAVFPTATELPDDERRPDGIAVDLTSSPPSWRDRGDSGDGVVTLRTPLGREVALATLRAFFDAVVREDITRLGGLMGPSAIVQDTDAQSAGRVQNVSAMWRDRFRKREYEQLAGYTVYREGDVRTFRSAELGTLPLAVRYLGSDPAAAQSDLVLHVPILTHSIKNERFFGSDLYFWLRRDDDRYVIYRMAEDIPF